VGEDVVGAVGVRSVLRAALDRVWVLLVAGALTGAVVVGIGGRLAMLLLRLTSPDSVHGVVSDDGFVIGDVTLAGTYNLVATGAGLGLFAAAAYTWVAPWLMGPRWFRRVTCALGAGAVVGSLLINDDGVDFTKLEPTWLAVALFIAIPATFGALIGVAVDRARSSAQRPGSARKRLVIAVLLIALFPPIALLLIPVALVVFAWSVLRDGAPLDLSVTTGPVGFVVRAAWLLVASIGLRELVADIQSLS
jgi:hypothetical protein